MPSSAERPLVVYVDDETLNLTVFQASYGHAFNIAVFSSPAKAVEGMQGKTVGVILSDQRMPEETGVNLLTRVKELHPDAIRVLVTAYADHEPMIQAVNRAQIDRLIPKPWDHREMEELLQSSMDTYFLRLRVKNLELGLISAQRTDSLGKLATSLVHDMASPLLAITANVERMRSAEAIFKQLPTQYRDMSSDAVEILNEMPELLSDLEMSTQYLTQLVNGIRDHWRPTFQEGTADVKAVVEFVKRLILTRARNARVKLAFDVIDVPNVKIASSAMCQVVTNFMVNAIQAFDDAAQVREVKLVVRPEGEGANLTVTDTGRGIEPSVLERLGKEQITTKAAGEGMGMGVLSSRALILRAGGRFQMTSNPGEGTKAELWLPFA